MDILKITSKVKPYEKFRRSAWFKTEYIYYTVLNEMYKGNTDFHDYRSHYTPSLEDLTAMDWEPFEEE